MRWSRTAAPLLCVMAAATLAAAGRQSKLQKRLFDRLRPRAAAASASARAALLGKLGSQAMRDSLRACCPDVAGLAPANLLQRVRDEVLVSEVVHNFCATSVPTGRFGGRCAQYGDFDLRVAPTAKSFYNAWTMQALNLTAPTPWNDGFMERAEVGMMGYPPFGCRGAGCVPSPAAAKERPVYAALNLDKTDMGFAALGTVAAVFKTSYIANMTLVSATDTGWWENLCNRSAPRGNPSASAAHRGPHAAHRRAGASAGVANCSALAGRPPTFGTLHNESFDHLLLGNVEFWQPSGWSLSRLFSRMFGDYSSPAYPPVGDTFQFIWEPDVAGEWL